MRSKPEATWIAQENKTGSLYVFPFLDRGNIVALYVCKYDTNVWLCQ